MSAVQRTGNALRIWKKKITKNNKMEIKQKYNWNKIKRKIIEIKIKNNLRTYK